MPIDCLIRMASGGIEPARTGVKARYVHQYTTRPWRRKRNDRECAGTELNRQSPVGGGRFTASGARQCPADAGESGSLEALQSWSFCARMISVGRARKLQDITPQDSRTSYSGRRRTRTPSCYAPPVFETGAAPAGDVTFRGSPEAMQSWSLEAWAGARPRRFGRRNSKIHPSRTSGLFIAEGDGLEPQSPRGSHPVSSRGRSRRSVHLPGKS